MATQPISAEEKLDIVAAILAMREHFDARLDGTDMRLARLESKVDRILEKLDD